MLGALTQRIAAGVMLAAGAATAAWAEEVRIDSNVAAATIYPQGATLSRKAAFEAPLGRHEIMVEDLPLSIDAESLRVSGASAAGFTILGLNYRIERPSLDPVPLSEQEALKRQIRDLEWRLEAEERKAQDAQARRAYMEAFRAATMQPPLRKKPTAQSGGIVSDVGAWGEAWGLIAQEVADADTAYIAAAKRMDELRREISKLQRKLSDAGPPPPPRGLLTISIDAPSAVEDGELTIEYQTDQAQWSPLYDLKLDAAKPKADGQRQLTIIRRAAISQTTGEDWADVEISLSTSRPSGGAAAPKPRPIQAVLVNPRPPIASARPMAAPKASRQRAPMAEAEAAEQDFAYAGNLLAMDQAAPEPVASSEASALVRYQGAAAVYDIAETVRIPGDGETRQALINETSQKVSVVARATPSLRETAYLYASYENADAPLLPGRATLYRDGVYLGGVDLEYVAPGAKTGLPFGVLDAITVKHRVKKRSDGERGVFTTTNARASRFELTAQNLGDEALKVTLFDSLPFTETEKIEVDLKTSMKPTEQDVNGVRGALAWTFALPAGGDKSIDFGYDLSWPEGQKLIMR